jgi:gamma-glutamylaminecyclotransferase
MKTKVFVYGTLKRGLSNHGWLRGQTFLGEAQTEPDYRLYKLGGYPGMVRVADGAGLAIRGEVWEVDEAGLAGLDMLEGVLEGEYALAPIQLEGEWAGRGVQCYVYLRSVTGCREAGAEWTE